jgi:3-hydroxybutyryl-CoA dehydrogenase
MKAGRQTVGVVGAGVIGRGVAQAFAAAGHPVLLVDRDEAIVEQSATAIERALRLDAMTRGGPPSGEVMDRLRTTVRLEDLATADFIIENATEDWDVKRPIFETLDRVAPAHAVFAANTSCIPIARFASACGRPDRVLGLHFMNPVPLKEAVEVIRGQATSDATMATAIDLLAGIGKRGIVVNDAPGFVINRVLMLTVNEAAAVVGEGTSDAKTVDELFQACLGHAMGPLATADLIGLDTIVRSLEVLLEERGDERFRPAPLLRQMAAGGHLGRKSGRGFHDYGTRRQG